MQHLVLVVTIALLYAQAAGAQGSSGQQAAHEIALRRAHDAGYQALPDLPGTGLYPAIKETVNGLPEHTIYRPANLDGLGDEKLAVLLWGNGGCVADGAHARLHLLEIASHGYLAIAPGRIRSGPGATPDPDAKPVRAGTIPPPATRAADLLAGLDWALAENAREGSMFAHRIDPGLVAVAGWSCGGLQALEVASDPRIRAVIIHNSGIYPDGEGRIPGYAVSKSLLDGLHTPVLYVLGGPGDIAHANGTDDFLRIDTVPVMLADLQVGHVGTFREAYGGRVAQVAIDWLEWQLRADHTAARTFLGDACRLCLDPTWTLRRKGFQEPSQLSPAGNSPGR